MKMIQRFSLAAALVSMMIFLPAHTALKPHAPTTDELRAIQQWQRDVARDVWEPKQAQISLIDLIQQKKPPYFSPRPVVTPTPPPPQRLPSGVTRGTTATQLQQDQQPQLYIRLPPRTAQQSKQQQQVTQPATLPAPLLRQGYGGQAAPAPTTPATTPTTPLSQEGLNTACAEEVYKIIDGSDFLHIDEVVPKAANVVQERVDALLKSFPHLDTDEKAQKDCSFIISNLPYDIESKLDQLIDKDYDWVKIAPGKKITNAEKAKIFTPIEAARKKILTLIQAREAEERKREEEGQTKPQAIVTVTPPAPTPLIELPEPTPSAARDEIIRQILEISDFFPSPASLTFEADDRMFYYLGELNNILKPYYSPDQRNPICNPHKPFLHKETFPFLQITRLPKIPDKTLQQTLDIARETKARLPKTNPVIAEDAIEMYEENKETYAQVKSIILNMDDANAEKRQLLLKSLEEAKSAREGRVVHR